MPSSAVVTISTAVISVQDVSGAFQLVRVLLDPVSQANFISEKLILLALWTDRNSIFNRCLCITSQNMTPLICTCGPPGLKPSCLSSVDRPSLCNFRFN
ncbi:hypothetical protein PR048_010209 [Dryococelus australis]|uniref:Uncharacterized protein n=1 Tax=Dryococelus australis TaxID=614101 RepID=A0ABQ9I236_9NEOP|nr:hypothetical protein PR048_010209 [Dryococelus australis]